MKTVTLYTDGEYAKHIQKMSLALAAERQPCKMDSKHRLSACTEMDKMLQYKEQR